MVKRPLRRTALLVALAGMMGAILECSKLALAVLPNIEVVTLFTALFSYVFGAAGFFGALIFVLIEPLLWGFGGWAIAYLLYWPLVSLVFWLLARGRVKNRWLLAGVAVLLTAWFGVLTSLIDVGLFSGSYDNFFARFGVYYARGIVFYALQIACNAVLFPALFPLLSRKLAALRDKMLR